MDDKQSNHKIEDWKSQKENSVEEKITHIKDKTNNMKGGNKAKLEVLCRMSLSLTNHTVLSVLSNNLEIYNEFVLIECFGDNRHLNVFGTLVKVMPFIH